MSESSCPAAIRLMLDHDLPLDESALGHLRAYRRRLDRRCAHFDKRFSRLYGLIGREELGSPRWERVRALLLHADRLAYEAAVQTLALDDRIAMTERDLEADRARTESAHGARDPSYARLPEMLR